MRLANTVLLAGLLAATGAGHAKETYRFISPFLDGAIFNIAFTPATALADGDYEWGTSQFGENASFPADAWIIATDGYTALGDPGDLVPEFSFTVLEGAIVTYTLSVQDPNACTSYGGCNRFQAIGSSLGGSTRIVDSLNPNIIGYELDGHHIAEANAGKGLFVYQFSPPDTIPEPPASLLLLAGMGLLAARSFSLPASRSSRQRPTGEAGLPV